MEDGKTLIYDGKLVAKKTSFKGIVKTGLEETKGCGARKLNVYLKDNRYWIGPGAINFAELLFKTRPFPSRSGLKQFKSVIKSTFSTWGDGLSSIETLDIGTF